MEVGLAIATIALILAAFFFWGRGILRSVKGDIVLGFSILAFLFVISVVVSSSSAIFSELGLLLIAFGIETLVVTPFARPDCPINRKDLVALGIGALIMGAFGSLIV